jgi:hypothetical protein
MIRAEHPLLVGEQLFEFGDRASDIPAFPASGGEVVAGGQRVGCRNPGERLAVVHFA